MSDKWLVVVQSPADGWQHSPPTYVGQPVLEVSANLGNLVLGDNSAELNLDIPSDARILTDEQGLLLVLTGATDRYPHGVVGDHIEAPSFALMDATLDESSMITVEVESNSVSEGLSLIWADIDEDGEREIIVTVSNHQVGAELVMSASLRGYTSHRIGSRDLDMAATVDFDGDGTESVNSI